MKALRDGMAQEEHVFPDHDPKLDEGWEWLAQLYRDEKEWLSRWRALRIAPKISIGKPVMQLIGACQRRAEIAGR